MIYNAVSMKRRIGARADGERKGERDTAKPGKVKHKIKDKGC